MVSTGETLKLFVYIYGLEVVQREISTFQQIFVLLSGSFWTSLKYCHLVKSKVMDNFLFANAVKANQSTKIQIL